MTWDAHQRREAVLRAVMDLAENRRDGRLPWDSVGAEQAFDTPAELLGRLQMRWHTRLTGAIERELVEEPWDLEQAVVHAWRGLAADMPGVRAVLDTHADEPAMQRARRKEWVLLATASGLVGMDDPQAAPIGHRVEQRARSITVHKPTAGQEPAPRGWLSRLRHALAA